VKVNGGRDQVLDNVLRLLRLLSTRRYVESLDRLADEAGMTRRQLYRYLASFERHGFQVPRWRMNREA
jgi:DNA-binding IclR family transcriptional regulator